MPPAAHGRRLRSTARSRTWWRAPPAFSDRGVRRASLLHPRRLSGRERPRAARLGNAPRSGGPARPTSASWRRLRVASPTTTTTSILPLAGCGPPVATFANVDCRPAGGSGRGRQAQAREEKAREGDSRCTPRAAG